MGYSIRHTNTYLLRLGGGCYDEIYLGLDFKVWRGVWKKEKKHFWAVYFNIWVPYQPFYGTHFFGRKPQIPGFRLLDGYYLRHQWIPNLISMLFHV